MFYSVGQYETVCKSVRQCPLIGESVRLLYTVWMDPPRLEELLCGEGQLADAASYDRVALVIKQSSQQQQDGALDGGRQALGIELRDKVAVGVVGRNAEGHLQVLHHEGVEGGVITETEVLLGEVECYWELCHHTTNLKFGGFAGA